MNVKYMIKRIAQMDYASLFRMVNSLHERTHKNRVFLFTDIVRCGLKYGAGYNDYSLFEFYNLPDSLKDTYVTRGRNNQIVKLLNDPNYTHILDDKVEFNEVYSKYIHRDWMAGKDLTLESFTRFMADKEDVIIKPLDATCGEGVEKLYKKDFPTMKEFYDYVAKRSPGIIEEVIRQHPDVSRIYPHSINTYRIVTVLSGGESHVVYAVIRMGNNGKVIDNINAGGMSAPINITNGVIEYPAYDKNYVAYPAHPMTKTNLIGYQLPYWKEAVDMCLEAAHVVEQIGYVGWDIAIAEDGPQLIEGNPFPSHDISQMPSHSADKKGQWPLFKKYVKGL